LSSFQTSYASAKQLDYSLFFLGFMSAAISCRLLIAGFIVKRDPYRMACLLTALMVLSVLMFMYGVDSAATYVLAAVVLGVGYGLTYSVINGLAANEAPVGQTAQSLVLFSLGVFRWRVRFPAAGWQGHRPGRHASAAAVAAGDCPGQLVDYRRPPGLAALQQSPRDWGAF
jgi:hypothetical protein